MSKLLTRTLFGLAVGQLLTACGSINTDNILPDKQVEYRKEVIAEKNLEVPPDLTANTLENRIIGLDSPEGVSTTYSEYSGLRKSTIGRQQDAAVLPEIKGMEVERIGQERWLVIDGPAETVWQRVVQYWQDNGILLLEEDPTVGVMRTGWLENRADIPNDLITDFFRGFIDGFYEADTRDQFRLRLERGERPGTTELYLTHFGMEQVLAGGAADDDRPVWKIRPRDPGLEAVILRRIMVHLGVSEAQAEARMATAQQIKRARTQLVHNRSDMRLKIDDSFTRSWRLVGLALDRVGFAVEDRDRAAGVYYVRYNDPSEDVEKGWLSSLAFWRDEDIDTESRYQVRVMAADAGTEVLVLDEQGAQQFTPTALRILTLIQEQIK